MIVRILGEGQFEVADTELDALNALDATLEASLDSDQGAFATALSALLDRVREIGSPLADDALEPSEVVLPYAEATPDEVRGLLADDGLIPG